MCRLLCFLLTTLKSFELDLVPRFSIFFGLFDLAIRSLWPILSQWFGLGRFTLLLLSNLSRRNPCSWLKVPFLSGSNINSGFCEVSVTDCDTVCFWKNEIYFGFSCLVSACTWITCSGTCCRSSTFWLNSDSCLVISPTEGGLRFSRLHNISPFIGALMPIQDLWAAFLQVTQFMESFRCTMSSHK